MVNRIMLASLTIQNVVIIEKLTIAFESGLCALTGETGAGKSILLDSLGLALGMRADTALIRKGAEQASVSALFEVDGAHPSLAILREANLEAEESLILRRVLSADGRSKAFINDQPVSAGLLRQVGETLIEIHGQHDARGLLDPKTHRNLLDEYAGLNGQISALWTDWQEKQSALHAMQAEAQNTRSEEEYLRGALEDLDALELRAGEEEELATLRESLMHREKVLEALSGAYQALTQENDPVGAAQGMLARVSGKLGESGHDILAALDRAGVEISEAVNAIQALSVDLEQAEHNLETIDDRLFALRGQARKHNCIVDELPEIREKLAVQLDRIEHADDLLEEKVKEAEQARAVYVEAGKELRKQRQEAGVQLDSLVAKELAPLKMERAAFTTHIEPLPEEQWGPHGMDRVRFLVATNPGAAPGALNKIASGGEMARFMLALKVVMAQTGVAETLIFDEVDAGVGGAVADAVGERLARLAKDKQILVVTHSPQVAARADHHWIVRKDGGRNVKTTVLSLPSDPARREEIARMLAGASVTDEARAAADKLLEGGKAA